jgi:hypothetical protein
VPHFEGLQHLRALTEPVMLRHFFDQDLFGGRLRLVFGLQVFYELIVVAGIFAIQEDESMAGEAVPEVVAAGDFASGITGRTR